MKEVWVVYAEYSGGEGDLAAVLSVHATAEGAERAAAEQARHHAEEFGHILWSRNQKTGEVDPDHQDSDWDVDIHVEQFEVQA